MIQQVVDSNMVYPRQLRIELLRSDGVTIDLGSLTGGPDMPNTTTAHPRLIKDERWRDLVFSAW